jgi:hypothetical protein
MSATFGLGTPPISTNYTGNVQSFTDTTTATIKTYRDETGNTVSADAVLMKERKVSMEVVGTTNFGLTGTASVDAGVLTITSITKDETNDDYPKTKIEAVGYGNTVTSASDSQQS